MDLDAARLKQEKEAFVSGLNGGNLSELLITTGLLALAYLSNALLIQWISSHRTPSAMLQTVLHLIMVELTALLAYTYTEYIPMLLILHSAISVACYLRTWKNKAAGRMEKLNSNRKPFISVYRAAMMISTVIAILAVDFRVFPRRLAKTETFGYSLMDVGVGSFILSHAIVSPLTKSFSSDIHIAEEAGKGMVRLLLKMFTSVVPMLILGSARFFLVKSVDYQEHVSEYGTHWNFFFTLGVVALFSSLVTPKPPVRSGLLAVIIMAIYQFWLNSGLQDFILNAPRIDFISANKEGIYSSIGYFSLYLFGVELGYYLNQSRSVEKWKSCIVALLTWEALLIAGVYLFDYLGIPASRRLVNVTYILYIMAINFQGIALYLLATLVVALPQEGFVFAAVNKNQLFVFLGANLITGAVNLSINTLNIESGLAMLILCTYVGTVCSVAAVLHYYKKTIKFWA